VNSRYVGIDVAAFNLPSQRRRTFWKQRFQLLARGDHHQLGGGRPHRLVEVPDDVDWHARMVRVFVRLGPVPLNQQLVVGIRLDVEVAFARKTDHLHREVVLDAVVEQHLAVQRPDLRALVANDRSLKPKALDPRQRTRKGPTSAGHDSDPCPHHAAHRLDIAWIQLQRGAEDRAVEVEG